MAILRSSSSVRNAWATSVADERAMANLSDDLVAEIILKLPVKSVARSQCVAKNWCAAISDDYLRRRLPLQMGVVYFPDGTGGPLVACAADEGGVLEDRDLGFFPFRGRAVVCDACNGLLLLRSAASARFFVADPVTRRWAALPPPSRDATLSVLAFDPSTSDHYYVINFTGWRDGGAELEVFSSETRAWAARDADFGADADFLCGSVHVHGGAVYLLASGTDRAVRVDLAGAEPELACTVVELPEPVDGDGRLEHSAGQLHYVAGDGELLKVWVQDVEDQWRLKHAVKIEDVVGGACGGEARFLALHPEKDAVYVWAPWKLVEYDLARKEVTGAWEFAAGKGQSGEKNRVIKTWLVPSSLYLSSDYLAGRQRQC